MATTQIANLPSEMVLHIMECLPDVATLKKFILLNRRVHTIFKNHNRSIVICVLKNELGEDLLIHAVVAHHVEKNRIALPAFDMLPMDEIDTKVVILLRIRNQASILHRSSPAHSSMRVTLRDADRISLLWSKISQLSAAFVEDCCFGLGRRFYPLRESIGRRPVSVAELRRVRHSMYMFHILSIFCMNLFLDIQGDQDQQTVRNRTVECGNKVLRLQRSLVNGFMAPWELYQVLSLQAWFRRKMRVTEYDCLLVERLIPYVLANGIECMYQVVCIYGEDIRFNGFLAISRREERDFSRFRTQVIIGAVNHPAHAFGMVLSRGVRDNWTRKPPMDFDQYTAFWGSRDRGAYLSWRNLETSEMHQLGRGLSAPGSYHISTETEGILDVWSAAFWDAVRWPEIRRSMDGDLPYWPWRYVTLHWDSFEIGWESAIDPTMRTKLRIVTRRGSLMWRIAVMAMNILGHCCYLAVTVAAWLFVALGHMVLIV